MERTIKDWLILYLNKKDRIEALSHIPQEEHEELIDCPIQALYRFDWDETKKGATYWGNMVEKVDLKKKKDAITTDITLFFNNPIKLHQELKIMSIKKSKKISDLITEAIDQYLKSEKESLVEL